MSLRAEGLTILIFAPESRKTFKTLPCTMADTRGPSLETGQVTTFDLCCLGYLRLVCVKFTVDPSTSTTGLESVSSSVKCPNLFWVATEYTGRALGLASLNWLADGLGGFPTTWSEHSELQHSVTEHYNLKLHYSWAGSCNYESSDNVLDAVSLAKTDHGSYEVEMSFA